VEQINTVTPTGSGEHQRVRVTIFTDPGCPFGFNAQRQELQLLWHYGHAIDVTRRMIVLREQSVSFEDHGLTPERAVRGMRGFIERYGMPMSTRPQRHMAATLDACRAYVGARIHAPDQSFAMLRGLRRSAFSENGLLDEREVIRAAAQGAGIAPEKIDAWLADEGVGEALRDDMAASRSPLPEALALPHKLSKSGEGFRYSTGSAVFQHGDRRVVSPGFQPFAVHEVAIATVAPHVARRPAPQTVHDVLSWAPFPLATAEVAELRGFDRDAAQDELQQAGAGFSPSAGDGYWALT
jgi:predicted DsbA family dithiol-disulfide isomerase